MGSPQSDTDEGGLPGEVAAELEFDWDSDGGAPVAVVEAVASVTNQSPTDMEPLSTVIKPDAFDELFASTRSTPRNTGHVQFQYQGCYVRVSATGAVRVSLPTQ